MHATRDIVVVGASAGGVQALQTLVQGLPANFPAAVLVVVHIPPTSPSLLPAILAAAGPELQSANEEILSSNEELQSTNEELKTVNEELHNRNEELSRSNSDLIWVASRWRCWIGNCVLCAPTASSSSLLAPDTRGDWWAVVCSSSMARIPRCPRRASSCVTPGPRRCRSRIWWCPPRAGSDGAGLRIDARIMPAIGGRTAAMLLRMEETGKTS